MLAELTSLPALLKPHVIDFILAFFANSSDESLWVELTNVDFHRQMAFRGKMNHRFRKGALDILLAIHYNYWCISRDYIVIQHFQTFSLLLGFPYWRTFEGF